MQKCDIKPHLQRLFKHISPVKIAAIIPCHDHVQTLPPILQKLALQMPCIVVDDGSNPAVECGEANATVLRFEKNRGKAAALKAGFALAGKMGATHVLTIDSDGQHPPEYAAKLARKARENPDKIILAVRNFDLPCVPRGRRFLNKFSNFWFRAETGVRVADTQCGYRCYPLDVYDMLDLRLSSFAFEVEILVKAAWAGVGFEQVEIPTIYSARSLEKSHYRPVADTAKFSLMNARFFFTRLISGKDRLKKIALKK